MSKNTSVFYLEVQQVEKSCLFKLAWGQGQQLNARVNFPEKLSAEYQEWNDCYLGFYQTSLRGRVATKGYIAPPPIDWHAKLVEAEAKLLSEFHQWLRSGELYDVRSILEDAVIDLDKEHSAPIDVFLTCSNLNLERLPWEAWEIKKKIAATGKIRIIRKPWNIQEPTVKPQKRDRKARVLVILGDDTGLDFKAEKEALKSLDSVATIKFVGWQPGKDIEALKSEIVNAIIDECGWDVLFFAGHTNETALTGGEIAIAPNVSLFLQELAPSLTIAKERGLQFALFNSCNGLSLANSLINLGLSQVAIMREPVHNSVAEEFLVQFLQSLAQYKDVHAALLAACQYLKLEKHLTYPSASLVPSFFRHPNAELFRFKRFGWRHKIKPWLPRKKETIAFATLAFISWQLPVQSILLRQRVLVQAVYRQVTNQVPIIKKPPILLVEIDDESIKKAKISNPTSMDRSYLAKLVDKLSSQNAKVVGFDYLLDRYQPENDQKFAQFLRNAVQNHGTWFVFASLLNDQGIWLEILPELADSNWSLQGNMRGIDENLVYMRVAPFNDEPFRRVSLGFLLALAHRLNINQSAQPPFPQLQSSTSLLSQIKTHVKTTTNKDYKDIFSSAGRVQPLMQFSYHLKQMWLQPILDFSIPPEQVYQSIPAWKLLETSSTFLEQQQQPVVLIAPGGHGDAGITGRGEDNFPMPPAVKYWRTLKNPGNLTKWLPGDLSRWFPGGGAHAYMIHHFLNQRIIKPIPDLWLVIIAALLGKGIVLALKKVNEEKEPIYLLLDRKSKWFILLTGATGIYGLASLQLYISAAVVLPFILPMVTIWSFIFLSFSERKPDL
ncbi:MAG: CHASE2 domain-containing protein [Coleofasciculaceae cyanobacterium]